MNLQELMKELNKLQALDDSAPLPWTVGQLREIVDSLTKTMPGASMIRSLINKKGIPTP